jgi:hypothetical protein
VELRNQRPEHGVETQELDGPEIGCRIQELSSRQRVVVDFTNQSLGSCEIHEREP